MDLIFCLCFNSEPNTEMEVVMGGLSLNIDEPTEQTLRVEEAIRHENYRETPSAVYNDIGDPSLALILYNTSTDSTKNT